MTNHPWTDPDPVPGDFDADLATIAPELVQPRDGDAAGVLRIVVSVQGEDARRLERIAAARGIKPGDVVADLLRDADRPAA